MSELALIEREKRIVVPYTGGSLRTGTIRPSNGSAMLFGAGTTLIAKPGEFDHPHASMIDLSEREDVKLLGSAGAEVNMQWPSRGSAFRDCLKLRGAKRITVSGLRLARAGGDGANVGPSWTAAGNETTGIPCEYIELTDLDCESNGRNAITVAAVWHFRAKRCRFNGSTDGQSPYSGICVEAGHPSNPLFDVEFEWFEALGNFGAGINVALWRLTRSSERVSVRFRDGVVNSHAGHMLQFNFGKQPDDQRPNEDNRECPPGTVIFERINFTGCPAPYNAIRAEIWADIPDDFHVIFRRCRFANWGGEMPFRVRSRTGRHPFLFEDSSVVIAGQAYDAASFMQGRAIERIG